MSCQEDQTNQVQEKCGCEKTTSENSSDNLNHGCHMRSVWDPSVEGPHLGSGDASELSLAGAIPRHFFCPHPPQTDQVSWLSHLSREAGCSNRMVDYRFQYPITNHDSPEAPVQQCLLTPNQDYMLGAQSNPCHFLNPIPSVTNSSGHHSLSNNIPGTWATEATMHCGITSGELYDAVASICPESMNGHGCDDSRNELATHNLMEINQPATGPLTVYLQPLEQLGDNKTMLCNLGAGGQVVVVNHCSPGSSLGLPSAFRTDSTQAHTLLTPSQLLAPAPGPPMSSGYSYSHLPPPYYTQYHKPACPLYPEARVNAADSQPKAPVRLGGMIWDSKSKKPCNCTKSQCLKLYCDCFANGEVCSNCNCVNCYNNAEHEGDRYKAIKICLDRNPEAFRPKIGSGKSGEVKGRHNKGCNCKRSGCLKNYCECYEAKIMCSSTCKCVGCRNYEDSPERRTVEWDSPDTTFYKKANCQKDKCPLSCITLDVVEATCGCLLAQAEEAEREAHSLAHAERMILEEFGQCLTQIVRSIFKSTGL